MAQVHICSTLPIPTYERLAAFARDRGILHPNREVKNPAASCGASWLFFVNTSDAVRLVLDLALGNNDDARNEEDNDDATT